MKRRLFVDCDDTLVIYRNTDFINPYGHYMGTPFDPNIQLIASIEQVHDIVDLFIWSGGGKDYARMWGDMFFGGIEWTPLLKDQDTFPLVRATDVVIDDQPIITEGHYYSPYEFEWIKLIEGD